MNLLSIIAGCVDDGVDTLEAESLDRRVLAFYHWLLLKEKVLSFDLFFHFLSLMHAWARVRKRSCTPGKAWEGWVCRLFVCLFVLIVDSSFVNQIESRGGGGLSRDFFPPHPRERLH